MPHDKIVRQRGVYLGVRYNSKKKKTTNEMIDESFKYNDFTYTVCVRNEHEEELELTLRHNKPYPDFLYKYYSINDNNFHALNNAYLFASHPYQLNDKYDCSADLIDFSNCTLEFFIRKLNRECFVFEENLIQEKFNSANKWELESCFKFGKR